MKLFRRPRQDVRPSPRARRQLDALRAASLLAAVICVSLSASAQSVEHGKRIYREGVLPGGGRVRASVQGDVAVEGAQVSCASCHRRSGYGSSEGAAFVPPLTGSALFTAREPRGQELFRKLFQEVQPARFRARVRDPRPRPAYTVETLAAALRDGRDSSGRPLDPLMPRYRLSDEEVRHLVAYLKTLSNAPAPGVTPSAVHFATVVTPGVVPAKRRALLEVMRAYFRWKNADTEAMLRQPVTAGRYEEDASAIYREWVLHVWELKGVPESWPAQLAARYRERPVFALLGGAGEGDWRPVHDFCERAELPCLFPETNRPVVSGEGAYTLYLYRGLTGEAEALARHLRGSGRPERVLQVYREGAGGGPVLARALAREWRRGGPSSDLRERVIGRGQPLTRAFWHPLLEAERPSALVLWLGGDDLKTLGPASEFGGARPVYLSYGLLQDAPAHTLNGLGERFFLTYPFALSPDESPHVYRARAWLRARGVGGAHERLRLNAYLTLSVADHALKALGGNFFRDYFVETVEQETESAANPGVFPRLSLGPGQRFASKGCYIVKPAGGGFAPASGWIVP